MTFERWREVLIRKVDDSGYKKICLCREHHTIAHQMGVIRFRQMYKVYGIVVKAE